MPLVFLGLGLALGDGALGVIHVGLHDRALEIVTVLGLAFVLFLDAVNLRFDEAGEAWRAPMLALGPGTIITFGLTTAAAHYMLGLALIPALLLGAVLASIDSPSLDDRGGHERHRRPADPAHPDHRGHGNYRWRRWIGPRCSSASS